MANELRGVEVRLERASEHIDALKHEARMFLMRLPEPYGYTIPDKAIDGEYIVRAQIADAPPVRLGVLAADAAHNLRSALDMIAWQLALKGGNPPSDDDRQTAFPICTDSDYWKSRNIQVMISRIDGDAIKVIESFQPYNKPEPPSLSLIQGIDNWAKHHAIPSLMTFHISQFEIRSGFKITSFEVGRPFNDGDEICRVRRIEPITNPDEHLKARMVVGIGFSKDGPDLGKPLWALEYTHDLIRETILPAFQKFFPNE